ncbi:hypothetical protein ACMD2_16608 [Ananas comosus]|uniref:Uncharacterized protein n=1 Tax=Ananas comosus TaxID=4615 RepID=A0A199V6G0_ANACO|nr:hypothetical protein ACMD2_21696 [Ananas comosus]OAY82324.1 hypothetical protein ACMD2_16608 [Ananas comosus]
MGRVMTFQLLLPQ